MRIFRTIILLSAAGLLLLAHSGLDRARAAREGRLDWPMLSAAAAGGQIGRAHV